jgi:membrane protease YdiL (CAAX protease family)
VITFAFVVLVLPFAEEMFFRGVLFRWMSERLNVGAGIAISSLIFGAFHGDLGGAITATLLGAGLAWMYHTHRSLWSVTLVHALYNLFAVILSYFAPVIAR